MLLAIFQPEVQGSAGSTIYNIRYSRRFRWAGFNVISRVVKFIASETSRILKPACPSFSSEKPYDA
jgi:hypothetical protein